MCFFLLKNLRMLQKSSTFACFFAVEVLRVRNVRVDEGAEKRKLNKNNKLNKLQCLQFNN